MRTWIAMASPAGNAAAGKLFGRLNATYTP